MAIAIFVETFENLQHSTRLIPESRTYNLNVNSIMVHVVEV
jgi:hypothetical protein